MRVVIASLVISLGSTAAWAMPAPLEDLDLLDARVAVFLGGAAADAGRMAEPVDRRLRLLFCPEGVSFAAPAIGAIVASCPSKGWKLRIPVRGASAAAETVVRRGDTVELSVVGANFDVTSPAVATEDGSAGGVVRVKTSTGSSTVTARVRGPGRVSIGD